MRPPSYPQSLFVGHYPGESSASAVDVAHEPGINGLTSWGRMHV